jgi:Tfp pilus assembly protein PilO
MFKHLRVNIDDKKKALIITASIVFLMLLICFNIIKSHSRKRDSIRQDIQDQIKRIALRTDIEKMENIHQEYVKYFYDNIDQQALRAVISSLATESDVNIVSIKTLGKEQLGSLSKESLDISLRCNYNQLGIFISKIENLENTTKIESLSLQGLSDFRKRAALSEKEQEEIMEPDTGLSVSMVVSGYSTKA